jgi:serine/threonine-protein kinase
MTQQTDRLHMALAGRYRIERELGAGGMAIVYLAHDLKHDRKVALKLLKPDLARSLTGERFIREIAITARLNHPHILALLDSGRGCAPCGDRRDRSARARARARRRPSRYQA